MIFYFLSYLKLEWFARLYHLCTSNLYESIPTPNPSRSLYYYTTTNAVNQCTVVENYLSSRSLWPLIYPLPTSKTTTYHQLVKQKNSSDLISNTINFQSQNIWEKYYSIFVLCIKLQIKITLGKIPFPMQKQIYIECIPNWNQNIW